MHGFTLGGLIDLNKASTFLCVFKLRIDYTCGFSYSCMFFVICSFDVYFGNCAGLLHRQVRFRLF
jgi:hypothetical protein